MRIIVCGGRNYSDRAHVFASLDLLHDLETISEVIHGACGWDKDCGIDRPLKGADHWADEWALARVIDLTRVPADWTRCGQPAGRMRNREMLEMDPNAVVAFPGGPGTAHMVRIAAEQNVRVIQC